MQKNVLIIICLVGIVLVIIASRHRTAALTLTSNRLPNLATPLKISTSSGLLQLRPTSNQASPWHTAQLRINLIFPFTTKANGSLFARDGSQWLKPLNSSGDEFSNEKIKTHTFANLTNQESPVASSSFICPPDLPFALSYQLESPTQAVILKGQKYFNACIAEPGGSNNNDLLYGPNQNIDSNGKAENLSAYIPKYLPQGCHNQASNRLVTIKLAANTIQVRPIQISFAQESIVIGFQQTSEVNVDCNQVCNSMLNQDCANDFDYCGNSIIAAFKVHGVYQPRQIQENFCACKIYNPAWNGIYTQAVDIDEALNYTNRLSKVTCGNYPTHTNLR